jgi:Flp pilus assembly protein TadD
LLIATAVFAFLLLAVHVVSSRPAFSSMWGAHFYAFFAPAWLYSATLFVAGAIAFILITPQPFAYVRAHSFAQALARTRARTFLVVSIIAGGCLFWTFRICHTYLGDGSVLVQEVSSYHHLLPREPLTSLVQRGMYAVAGSWFAAPGFPPESVAQNALAVSSVLAGCLFLTMAWLLAGELSRLATGGDDRVERTPLKILLWLLLITQGYVQLFFGYVENYSYQAVFTVLFLALSLRYLRGACPLLWPAMVLCVCVALHFSSLLLGVPFLVLVAAGLRSPRTRKAALRDLAIVACGAVVILVLALRQYNPFATLGNMFRTAFASRQEPGYMFTGVHYRDFFNEQILIGPTGLFLFLGAAAGALWARKTRHLTVLFSLLAGVTFLAACWMMGDSNLGYARDWDMLAHTGIVFTTAGLALLLALRVPRPTLAAALVIALLISVFHTVPWIATNARETTSLVRLQTLPLGLGRTEVMLAWWYDRKGDVPTERAWLQRSIVVFNGNASAHYMLGMLDMHDRDYKNAIDSFQRTVALRPDKVEFHGNLAHAYYLADRFGEAAPDLQFIVSKQPENTMAVFFLGEALEQAGRCDDAMQMFLRAEPLCHEAVLERPGDSAAAATYGWVQYRLGQDCESLLTLERAAELDPPSAIANCYLGHLMQRFGSEHAARARFATCVATDAEVGDRAQIESWLAGNGPPPRR